MSDGLAFDERNSSTGAVIMSLDFKGTGSSDPVFTSLAEEIRLYLVNFHQDLNHLCVYYMS